MKNILFVALTFSLWIAGCASGPTSENLTDKNYMLKTVSLRSGGAFSENTCPVGARSWRHDSLRRLIDKANACERYKKTARLEQIGNLLAERFSTKPWGAFYLSLAAFDRSDNQRALWMIDLALKNAPQFGLLHYQKGRVLLALNELASANGEFHTAVRDEPDLTDARLYLAKMDVREQKYSNAADDFEKIVEIEPSDYAAWANLGETYILLQKPAKAINAYEHAVNLSPQNLRYQLRLGSLYENTKNYAAALNTYEKAAALAQGSRMPAEDKDVDINKKIRELEKVTQVAEAAKTKAKSGGNVGETGGGEQ